MKKIYVSPTVMVVAVTMQKMIAASNENEISIGDNYSGGTIGSRRGGSLWDDDEEYFS